MSHYNAVSYIKWNYKVLGVAEDSPNTTKKSAKTVQSYLIILLTYVLLISY